MFISAPEDEIAELQARVIARLGEVMFASVEIVHERLVAAETPEATERLALAVNRLGRGVRQCLLVEAKLLKDRRAMAREAAVQAASQAAQAETAQVETRKAEVRAQVGRALVEACEGRDDADAAIDELELWIEVYARTGEFERRAPQELAARLAADLGIVFAPGETPPWAETPCAEPPPAEAPPDAAKPVAAPPTSPVPPGPRLIQAPDLGWRRAPDSS